MPYASSGRMFRGRQILDGRLGTLSGLYVCEDTVECNSYGLTMWEVKTKYTVGTLGPIGSGG